MLQFTGKITSILVQDRRPSNDFFDVNFIISLDTFPGTRFGFRFGQATFGVNDLVYYGILDILRDAFNNNWQTTLDAVDDNQGKRIIRVQISKETMRM